MTTLGVYFLLALAVSLVLTPACRLVAHRLGFVAKPKEDRWHKRPTALLGGVAIAITVLAIGLTIRPVDGIWRLLACGALIAAFGCVDDVLSFKPSTKLIVQIAVASLLLFFGYRLQWTQSLVGDAMLTLFWIVGVTNAFNLLDNMDGLCGGITLIAGTILLVGASAEAVPTSSTIYLATLLGATAGFLVYNLHPASIFMGDTGSLFLGLNLAALTLMVRPEGAGKSGLLSVVAIPVLLLLIPIVDTTLVTAMRLVSGRRPSQGGRDHMSHRLVAVGLSEPRAVAILWTLAVASGLISLFLQGQQQGWVPIIALTFLLAMVIFAVYLGGIQVYTGADLAALRGQTFTPLVADFMYKRRVAEVLLDLCLIPLAYYAAYHLRFENDLLATNYQFFLQSLPVVLASQLLALFIIGGYRGAWRHFGMMDAVVLAKGVLLGTVGAELIILYVYRFESYSRSVFVIYAGLLLLLLAGTRASFRLVAEFIQRRSSVGQRCLIYGTGGATLVTVREAFGADAPIKIVGFIDDDPRQHRLRVSGCSVLGGFDTLLAMVEKDEIDCVVLNTRMIDVERLARLEAACSVRDIELLRLHVHVKPVAAVL